MEKYEDLLNLVLPLKAREVALKASQSIFWQKIKLLDLFSRLSIVIEGGCFGQRRQVERRKSSGKWELLLLSLFCPLSSCYWQPPLLLRIPTFLPTNGDGSTITITYAHYQPPPCADMWPKTIYASSTTWVFYQGYPSSTITIHTAKSHKWWLYFTNSLNFLNLDLKRWISVTHLVLQHLSQQAEHVSWKPSQSNWANIVRKIFSNIYKYFPMWGVSDFTISVSCRWLNHLFPEISIPWKIPLAEILEKNIPLRHNYHNFWQRGWECRPILL